MSQHASHLTEAQLEACVARCRNLSFDAESHRSAGHISACSECLSRFLRVYESTMKAPRQSARRGSQCPKDEDLRRLAAGICPPETAPALLRHVPGCGHCGPLLRAMIQDFNEAISEDGRALLAQTVTATPGWQRQMAKEMMRAGSPELKNDAAKDPATGKVRAWFALPPRAWMPIAGVAAVVAVAVGVGIWPMIVEINARQTSIEAYSDSGKRVIEMRLPSAQYAPYEPLPVTMGDTEQTRKSSALFESEAAVEKIRHTGKMDARWREIDARTALLEGTAGSAARAVDTFEKARVEGADSAALQIELAAATFERDSRADKPNLSKTIDILEGVLARPGLDKKDQAVALFNVAVAYEKINAWQLVVDRLDEYLKVEPAGPWTKEATARRDAARAKLPPPRPQAWKTPAFFFFMGLIPASGPR